MDNIGKRKRLGLALDKMLEQTCEAIDKAGTFDESANMMLITVIGDAVSINVRGVPKDKAAALLRALGESLEDGPPTVHAVIEKVASSDDVTTGYENVLMAPGSKAIN